jgi:Skp family chaperone for outer membrane proteins
LRSVDRNESVVLENFNGPQGLVNPLGLWNKFSLLDEIVEKTGALSSDIVRMHSAASLGEIQQLAATLDVSRDMLSYLYDQDIPLPLKEAFSTVQQQLDTAKKHSDDLLCHLASATAGHDRRLEAQRERKQGKSSSSKAQSRRQRKKLVPQENPMLQQFFDLQDALSVGDMNYLRRHLKSLNRKASRIDHRRGLRELEVDPEEKLKQCTDLSQVCVEDDPI